MRYTEIINEYSRDITAQKMGAALLQKFRKEPPQWQARVTGAVTDYDDRALDYLLELVERADPTKNKQYVPWIVRMYVNTPNLKFEDAVSKVSEPLKKFFQLVTKKQIPAPNNDIGRIKDLAGLVQTVDQYPDVVDQPKEADRGDAKELYRDAEVRVVQPQDVTAACYYGQGTKWCTAGKENNMFDRYAKDGPMYIVMLAKPAHPGEKYQFHFETKQFMDEKDRQTDVGELLDRYPQLRDFFRPMAEKSNAFTFLYSGQQIAQVTDQLSKELQRKIYTEISQRAEFMANNLTKEVFRSNSDVKEFMDSEELAEMLYDELDNPRELARTIAFNTTASDWMDPDRLYDQVFNLVGEWIHKTEAWEYMDEVLTEIDEDLMMDAGMALEGDLCQSITDIIKEIMPPMLKAALDAV